MNLKDFFEENEVKYWLSGKNVSSGWINIQCLYCNDKSNHLGIRKRDFKCSCWKCGGHYFGDVISKITGCSLKEAKKIMSELKKGTRTKTRRKDKNDFFYQNEVVLPKEATKEFPKIHLKYLKKRGYNPRKIIEKYNLLSCYTSGRYKFRIIIPIVMNRKIVAYTSRDVTNTQRLRYLTAKESECIINPKEVIYNYDSIKENKDAFLVEGPFDVWKMGDGSFSFLGIKITSNRLINIAKKKINNLYIFFDNDSAGKNAAKKVSRILSPVVKRIHILSLKKYDDPGSLNKIEISRIKRGLDFFY